MNLNVNGFADDTAVVKHVQIEVMVQCLEGQTLGVNWQTNASFRLLKLSVYSQQEI